MFGYITTNLPELKMKDYDKYKGYYCGLCKSLKECHGRRGQATLSYDLTFLPIFFAGLYEPETLRSQRRCIFHLMQKQTCIQNEYSNYAADMNILLTYYKFRDDWQDEKKWTSRCSASLLHSRFDRVIEKYPEKSAAIIEGLNKIRVCEEHGETNIDLVAGHFGTVFAEIFVYKDDDWGPILRKMGFYFGKFIYLMDAYEDLEKDAETGNYNPLIPLHEKVDYEENCKRILSMMMAECCKEFEKLPIIENVDILRNILYSGVWTRYELIQQKRKEQNA